MPKYQIYFDIFDVSKYQEAGKKVSSKNKYLSMSQYTATADFAAIDVRVQTLVRGQIGLTKIFYSEMCAFLQ